MKIKKLLPLFIAFVSFAGYSQVSTTDYTVKNMAPLYEISVDTDDLQEMRNLDWDMIRDISNTLGQKAELDSVKLKFTYNYPVMLRESQLDDFSYEVAGLKTELESLIAKSKNTVSQLKPIAKAESR